MMATEKEMAYSVIRTDRKSYEIAVLPEGSVRIRAPKRASDQDIQKVFDSKIPWIRSKLMEITERGTSPINRRYISGERFLFMGETYNLEIVEAKKAVRLIEDTLVVGIARNKLKGPQHEAQEVKKQLMAWYRQSADRIIKERMEHWQDRFGQEPTAVKVKEQKSRWGSCTGKNEILLNWKLVMAPQEIIDYVVLHELCHLKIRDHSPRYWELVTHFMPNWKDHRKWLKKNGHLLVL